MQPLTPEEMNQAGELIIAMLLFGALAFGLLGWAYFRFREWQLDQQERERVKPSASAAAVVMSRTPQEIALSAPSDAQTDSLSDRQTALDSAERRAAILDICRSLRTAGVSREKARAMLRGLGYPLDNNLWAEAAPSEEAPIALTPVARRPYNPGDYYEDNPDLQYKALG